MRKNFIVDFFVSSNIRNKQKKKKKSKFQIKKKQINKDTVTFFWQNEKF